MYPTSQVRKWVAYVHRLPPPSEKKTAPDGLEISLLPCEKLPDMLRFSDRVGSVHG